MCSTKSALLEKTFATEWASDASWTIFTCSGQRRSAEHYEVGSTRCAQTAGPIDGSALTGSIGTSLPRASTVSRSSLRVRQAAFWVTWAGDVVPNRTASAAPQSSNQRIASWNIRNIQHDTTAALRRQHRCDRLCARFSRCSSHDCCPTRSQFERNRFTNPALSTCN